MFGAGDVRIQEVPDATLKEPTDAVLRVVRACICGSDLWPCGSMEPSEQGKLAGHEAIGVVHFADAGWASPRCSRRQAGAGLDDVIESAWRTR
jgi:threonine dehydrogenase-like Zn-dependent dehydrogenase